MSDPTPAPGYQPRDFWERRLSEHFDLRGTGETGLSLAYNRACYALRRSVLARALKEQGFDPRGRSARRRVRERFLPGLVPGAAFFMR